MFAGHIPEDNAIVVDLSAAFGWTGSSGTYGVLGGTVAFLHGSSTNTAHPTGFYNYPWVEEHINVASDFSTTCENIDRSIRWAMMTVVGPGAINEDKFAAWSTRIQVLGLVFNTTTGIVVWRKSHAP
jgi:hypothetical protein